MLDWQLAPFDKLSNTDVFEILELRQRVFILEQQCIYPDIDRQDLAALHLLGREKSPGSAQQLAAYLRIIVPSKTSAHGSLGRIVISPEFRGQGLGEALLRQGILAAEQACDIDLIKISAQTHLETFYQRFGFETRSAPYDEDGISHIDMERRRAYHASTPNQ